MAKRGDILKSNDALAVMTQEQIQTHIYTIRGMQVMLDRDLAQYFGVETRAVNQAMKRNIERFPEDFVFQLTKEEWANLTSRIVTSSTESPILTSQNVTSSTGSPISTSQIVTSSWGGVRHMPYAFTEQGVSQLSSVLRSPLAAQMSVRIVRAFVAMRRYLIANAGILQRLDKIEVRQLQSEQITAQQLKDTNSRIDAILNKLDDGSLKAKIGVFFDDQMFDANMLVEEIVGKARTRIVLIDDYVTGEILQRFHDYAPAASIDCYVKEVKATEALKRKFTDYIAQYPDTHCELHTFEHAHDRWLIIDNTVYHFGASIKDLGKRWFAVDICTEYTADELISRL